MSTKTDNSNLILKGTAIAPGLACGRPFLLSNKETRAQERISPNGAVMPMDTNSSVDLEVNKLVSAFTMLSERLRQLFARAQSRDRADEVISLIFILLF
jgi:phosphoenolpyruvate-protein kinase (PTS system EI component)